MKSPCCVACALATVGIAIACAPPKQIEPPRIEDTGGEDIATEEERELEPAAEKPDEMTPEEKKKECCVQCDKGLFKDRTGQPPEKIPCADFTAELEEHCLEYFRTNPVMASECKGAAGPQTPEPDTPDAGPKPPWVK